MIFSWHNFFSSFNIVNNPTPETWDIRVGFAKRSKDRDLELALRLIELAWYFHRDQNDERTTLECIRDLAETLHFGYDAFYRNRESLKRGLARIGVSLREVVNRNAEVDYQYVRTILYYSGQMHLVMASYVAELIKRHSPETLIATPYLLDEAVNPIVKKFGTGASQEEQRQIKEDSISFFVGVINQYLDNNVLTADGMPEDVPPHVAEDVIRHLRLGGDEIRPIIGIDNTGRGVFKLPKVWKIPDGKNILCFVFKSNGSEIAWCQYLKNGERTLLQWDMPEHSGGIPIAGIDSIVRQTESGESGDEVLPALCLTGCTHILMPVVLDQTVKCGYKVLDGTSGIRQGRTLRPRTCYKVIALKDSAPIIVAYDNDGDEVRLDYPITHDHSVFSFSEDNSIDHISIGETQYVSANTSQDLFNLSSRCQVDDGTGNVQRVYYPQDANPFSDSLMIEKQNVVVKYVYNDVEMTLDVPDWGHGDEWHVPNECLWKKGVLHILRGGKIIKRPFTFVGAVSGIPPLEYGESWNGYVQVGYERKKIYVEIFDTCYTVVFDAHPQCKFTFPVPRYGVRFQYGVEGDDYIDFVNRNGVRAEIQIAKEDFESRIARLKIISHPDDNDAKKFVVCGGKPIELDNERTSFAFDALKITKADLESSGGLVTIVLTVRGKLTKYRFWIYRPNDTPITKYPNRHTVNCKVIGRNLVVEYFVPWYMKDGDRKLACLPAHAQDSAAIEINVDSVEHRFDDCGRCVETCRIDIEKIQGRVSDWGKGLICFMIEGFGGSELINRKSSGFFLSPEVVGIPEGDITGNLLAIRTAMATNSIEELAELLRNCREEDKADFGNLYDGMLKNAERYRAYTYMNGFYNTVLNYGGIPSKSGYLFAAEWFFREHMDKYKLPKYCKRYWSSLMFCYADDLKVGKQNSIPQAAILTMLCDCSKIGNHGDVELMKLVRHAVSRVLEYSKINNSGEATWKETHYFSVARFCEEIRVLSIEDGKSLEDIYAMMPDLTDDEKAPIRKFYQAWTHDDMPRCQEMQFLLSTVTKFKHKAEKYHHAFRGYPNSRFLSCGRDCYKEFNDYPDYDVDFGVSTKNLYDALMQLAKRLYKWRMNPKWDDNAMILRRALIAFEEIDTKMETKSVKGQLSYTDAIDLMARAYLYNNR